MCQGVDWKCREIVTVPCRCLLCVQVHPELHNCVPDGSGKINHSGSVDMQSMACLQFSPEPNRPSMTCLAVPYFKACLTCTNFSASVISLLLWCTKMQNCSQNICRLIKFPLKVGTSNLGKFIPHPFSVGKALCTGSCSRHLILQRSSKWTLHKLDSYSD